VAGRRHTAHVDNVLDADWHAVQWATRSPGDDLLLRRPGRVHRSIAIKPDEDIQLRVEPFDPAQHVMHVLDWRQLSRRESSGCCRGAKPVQLGFRLDVVHHQAPRPMPARIEGHGSATGSVGASILAALSSASRAAIARHPETPPELFPIQLQAP
jgi:hypothetical protein